MPRTTANRKAIFLFLAAALLICVSMVALWLMAQAESRLIREENTVVAREPAAADPRVLELGRHIAESMRKWDR